MKRIIACLSGIILSVLLLFSGCDETTLEDGNNDGKIGAFTVFREENGLANNRVQDMAIDYTRNGVWFATGKGVSFYSNTDSLFYTWGSDSGLPYLFVTTIAVSPLGTVWAGTESGTASFDSEWAYKPEMGGHANQYITDIEVISTDLSIWFGTKGGVAVSRASGWTSYIQELGSSSHVTSIEYHLGKIWIGTLNGISVFDTVTNLWQTYGAESLPSTMVNALFSDGAGTIWVGTASVAAAFNGSAWTTYGQADGLDTYGINDFTRDNYGTIWAATDGGVYTFAGGKWGKITLPSEITGSPVQSVLYDSINDAFWFGTLNGVVRYDTTTGN